MLFPIICEIKLKINNNVGTYYPNLNEHSLILITESTMQIIASELDNLIECIVSMFAGRYVT